MVRAFIAACRRPVIGSRVIHSCVGADSAWTRPGLGPTQGTDHHRRRTSPLPTSLWFACPRSGVRLGGVSGLSSRLSSRSDRAAGALPSDLVGVKPSGGPTQHAAYDRGLLEVA